MGRGRKVPLTREIAAALPPGETALSVRADAASGITYVATDSGKVYEFRFASSSGRGDPLEALSNVVAHERGQLIDPNTGNFLPERAPEPVRRSMNERLNRDLRAMGWDPNVSVKPAPLDLQSFQNFMERLAGPSGSGKSSSGRQSSGQQQNAQQLPSSKRRTRGEMTMRMAEPGDPVCPRSSLPPREGPDEWWEMAEGRLAEALANLDLERALCDCTSQLQTNHTHLGACAFVAEFVANGFAWCALCAYRKFRQPSDFAGEP